MRMSLVAAGFLAVPLAAQAALPPQSQRQRELQLIISSAEVEAALGSRPIDSISTIGDDTYTITAGACSLVVAIVDAPEPAMLRWVSPGPVRLEIGKLSCVECRKAQPSGL